MKVNIGKYKNVDAKRTIKVTIDKWDTWSLDHTLALIILPALQQFKEKRQGVWMNCFPEGYYLETPENKELLEQEAINKQNEIIDKMIRAFQHIVNDCTTWDKQISEEIDEGLKLFAEHYRGLWN